MNAQIDNYLLNGCGRCPLGGTAGCKVNNWKKELAALRSIVLECGLQEDLKWGVPCYTFSSKNVLIVAAFKEYCSISFFEGALLQDTHGLLEKPGENTQGGRLIRFTDVKTIAKLKPVLKAYIFEALEAQRAGLKVVYKKNPEPLPAELLQKFKEMPKLQKAFDSLTPGRQRSYIIHISGAKQSQTRMSRVEKCIPKIMDGLGFND